MNRPLTRALAIALSVSLLPSCIVSRLVDRAFLGISVRRPQFPDRKTTGVFLLPLTFAVDVATFPIQALLVVILGDNFPFPRDESLYNVLVMNDDFQRLEPDVKARSLAELDALMRSGRVTAHTALALGSDGHWTVVVLDDEARAQLLARASTGSLAVCSRE
jgi:hypothetical protein